VGRPPKAQKILLTLLRDLRRKAGLRHVDMAEALCKPQAFISYYESGARRLDFLELRQRCEVAGAHGIQIWPLPLDTTRAGVAHPGWMYRGSGSGSVVVVQQSAETLPSFDFSTLTHKLRIRANQLVVEALMVAFAVVMQREFDHGPTN
jgi:hypothetical protein